MNKFEVLAEAKRYARESTERLLSFNDAQTNTMRVKIETAFLAGIKYVMERTPEPEPTFWQWLFGTHK